MKIVIDLNDEILEQINNSDSDDFDGWIESDLIKLIQNGTSLPKDHGRLIDADALMVYCRNQKSRTIDCNDIARFPTTVPRVIAESEEEQ